MQKIQIKKGKIGETELTTIDLIRGVLNYKAPGQGYTWEEVFKRNRIEKILKDWEVLPNNDSLEMSMEDADFRNLSRMVKTVTTWLDYSDFTVDFISNFAKED
jgi:hypothetical protein